MKYSKICKCMAAALLLCHPFAANSADQWSGFRKITNIYPHADGLNFFLDGQPIGSGCEGLRFNIPLSASNYEVIASSLMTAFAGDMQVNVNYDDTTLSECAILINRVQVVR